MRPVNRRDKLSSQAKGKGFEDEIAHSLKRMGIPFERSKWFSTPFGHWEVDIFVNGEPPTVIVCKDSTAEAKSPAGGVQRKAQEALFKLYMLRHHYDRLPANTRHLLVLGDLPLVVESKQFGRRDYVNFLRTNLEETLHILSRSDLSKLGHLVRSPQGA